MWAPIRGPFAFLALVHLPWMKAFSLVQVTMLLVSWSISLADSVWTVFVQVASASSSGFNMSASNKVNTAMSLPAMKGYLPQPVGWPVFGLM